jgi:putative transposase
VNSPEKWLSFGCDSSNGRLKRLLADALLEYEVMKEALRKKW